MRTLPLLLVISTTLFHLAFANLCSRATYGGAGQNFGTGSVVNVNSTFTVGTTTMGGDCAVFSSSCKADHIDVTSKEGHLFKIYRDTSDPSKVESLGNQNGRYTVTSGRCNNHFDCPLEIFVSESRRNFVQIELPEGVIIRRGMGLEVRAVCTARPSTLICRAGYCEWSGTGNEGGSPDEADWAPVTVVDSAGSSHSGNVFGSPCNADQIHVTNDAGGYAYIAPQGSLVEHSEGMSVTAGGCVASDFVIGPGKSLSECPIRYVVDKEQGGVLRIFVKNGIITSSGAGIKATARCNGTQSPVVCSEGKCEGPGVSGGDGSSGEEHSVTPGKPIGPFKPINYSVINDDRSDSGSDRTTTKDSINENSKQIESTTEADEKTSTTLIVVFVVVGILALAGFGAFLVCILKNRSSNVDEADVEEGDADTKTDVISDVTSEQ